MKALLALALLLALPGAAAADYQPAKVYVIAVVPYESLSVSAVEFAIANLPDDTMCQITAHWNTDLIIGNLETGIALAFDPMLAGPNAVLGRLEFIAWEPFPDNYVIEVVPTVDLDPGNLVIVNQYFEEMDAGGGIHTFNCTSWCGCNWDWIPFIGLFAEEAALTCYQDIDVFTTPAAESSWSAVKSLY